jgi:hypothetical protein
MADSDLVIFLSIASLRGTRSASTKLVVNALTSMPEPAPSTLIASVAINGSKKSGNKRH